MRFEVISWLFLIPFVLIALIFHLRRRNAASDSPVFQKIIKKGKIAATRKKIFFFTGMLFFSLL